MTDFNPAAAAAYGVQDYSPRPRIEGVEIVELKRFNDDGGAMTELGRLDGGAHKQLPGFQVRQVNFSTLDALVIKAFHLHRRQTDVWYVPPSDKLLVVLADVRKGSKSEGQVWRLVLGDGNSRLLRIPPGVAHGCRNLRPTASATIVYFVDVQFSTGDDCDEGRLPWDHFGEGVWDVERG
jgi:dTDP-4-dehydrorhamnose 3,5-epimerase